MHVLRNYHERARDTDIRDEIRTHLARVPLFGDLTHEQLDYLADQMEAREYEPNERIFLKGTVGDELHVVLDGIVVLRDRDASGHDRVVTTLSRGDSFGEIGFLTGEPRTLTAYNGAEPGLQLVLSRPCFESIVTRMPGVALRVMERLLHLISQRMRKLPIVQRNYLMWGYRQAPFSPEPASRCGAAGIGALVAAATAAWLIMSPSGARFATPQAAQWALALIAGILTYAFAMWVGAAGGEADQTSALVRR